MSELLKLKNIEDILSQRDIQKIYPSLKDFPHYSLLKDMNKATQRIATAIENNEIIYLIGDYDCDGVCSTALMVEFFRDIGHPIEYIIPDRFTDGYGVSASVFKKIPKCNVAITVDNGIVAHEGAAVAKERGIDLIITDHHTPGDRLPDCYAVVNPKRSDCPYPFKDICGAQVAFLLCSSIKHHMGIDINMSKYLDILATAVVADVMPLVEINRHIVKAGLKRANTKVRPFFKALLSEMGKEAFAYDDFGFQIAPRINSAGRLLNARIAVDALLATEDNAKGHVEYLSQINNERKNLQNQVYKDALAYVGKQKDFILVIGKELHEGIVGIVASKIAEETGYPTLVLSENEDGTLKGSGRSVGAVNIYNLINSSKDLLIKFGGHAGACGLSIDKKNIEKLSTALKKSSQELPRDMFIDANEIIGNIDAGQVSLELVEVLDRFAPYGEKNPHPLFSCECAEVITSTPMGVQKNHTSLTILWDAREVRMALFSTDSGDYTMGDKISFNYSVSVNEWKGNRSAQVSPVNIKKVG